MYPPQTIGSESVLTASPSTSDSVGGAATKLTRRELRRRLVHMLPGMLSLALLQVPHLRPLPLFALTSLAALIALMGMLIRHIYPSIARPGETHWTNNILRYSATIVAMLFLFPSHPEFAAVVVAVIAFGDGSATLFGLWIGGQRLPWNSQKTWAGAFAFVLCAAPLATLAYWLETRPPVSLTVALTCAIPAVICGLIGETMPWKSQDNLRVGLGAAIGVVAAHLTLFGTLA